MKVLTHLGLGNAKIYIDPFADDIALSIQIEIPQLSQKALVMSLFFLFLPIMFTVFLSPNRKETVSIKQQKNVHIGTVSNIFRDSYIKFTD